MNQGPERRKGGIQTAHLSRNEPYRKSTHQIKTTKEQQDIQINNSEKLTFISETAVLAVVGARSREQCLLHLLLFFCSFKILSHKILNRFNTECFY